MPLKRGSSKEVIQKNIDELIASGKNPKEAEAIAYKNARVRSGSHRTLDGNGWSEIKGNPLSKVGVFPYYGRQIHDSLEPDRIYQVYRPASELSDPACLESFKLVPWTDDHAMLGSEDDGLLPAEQKGVHGVIGEDVYFEDGYLKGNLKIYSERLASLIERGKKELSIGYRCLYDVQRGAYNGQHYDAVQRRIRGNHVALVEEGRAGRDVRVLDHGDVFTLDSKELLHMTKKAFDDAADPMTAPDTTTTAATVTKTDMEMMRDDINALKSSVSDIVDKLKSWDDTDEIDDPDYVEAALDADGDDKDNKDKDKVPAKKDGMDAAIRRLTNEVNELKKGAVKAVVMDTAARNSLYNELSKHVGAFAYDSKTYDEIARYGIEKLKLSCRAGEEVATLNGFFSGARKAETVVLDSVQKPATKQLDAYFAGSK